MCLAVLDPWCWLVANENYCLVLAHHRISWFVIWLVNRGRPQLMNAYLETLPREHFSWPWLTCLALDIHDLDVWNLIFDLLPLNPILLLFNNGACDGPINGWGASSHHCWHNFGTLHSLIHTMLYLMSTGDTRTNSALLPVLGELSYRLPQNSWPKGLCEKTREGHLSRCS